MTSLAQSKVLSIGMQLSAREACIRCKRGIPEVVQEISFRKCRHGGPLWKFPRNEFTTSKRLGANVHGRLVEEPYSTLERIDFAEDDGRFVGTAVREHLTASHTDKYRGAELAGCSLRDGCNGLSIYGDMSTTRQNDVIPRRKWTTRKAIHVKCSPSDVDRHIVENVVQWVFRL